MKDECRMMNLECGMMAGYSLLPLSLASCFLFLVSFFSVLISCALSLKSHIPGLPTLHKK